MQLLKVHETIDPTVSWIHKASVLLLVAWLWDSSRVMSLFAEEYMAYDEQLFAILAAWKNDSCRVVKSSTPGRLASCQPLLYILATWICDCSRVMRTSEQGYPAFIEIQLTILAAWKCDSLSFLRTSVLGYEANFELVIGILCTKNPIHCTSWNPCIKVHGFCVSIFSNSVDWRWIPHGAWDPLPIAI
jgi:hypothetical protein